MKQILTQVKVEIDGSAIIVGNLNISLSIMYTTRFKINKEIEDHKSTGTDIYKTFHTTTEEYTFFSSAHGTFSTIDYMLGHKTSLIKF